MELQIFPGVSATGSHHFISSELCADLPFKSSYCEFSAMEFSRGGEPSVHEPSRDALFLSDSRHARFFLSRPYFDVPTVFTSGFAKFRNDGKICIIQFSLIAQ